MSILGRAALETAALLLKVINGFVILLPLPAFVEAFVAVALGESLDHCHLFMHVFSSLRERLVPGIRPRKSKKGNSKL